MNEAYFQILGFTVPSGQYIYHDDGYVDSITDATKRINELYGFDNSYYNMFEDIGVIGRHCKIGFNSHIFYLRRPTIALDIQNRSHEETHALSSIGQLDVLTDMLLEEQGVKINLKEVDDEEVRAQLGSLYALNARYPPDVISKLPYGNITFSIAQTMYKQAKQPMRRFFVF